MLLLKALVLLGATAVCSLTIPAASSTVVKPLTFLARTAPVFLLAKRSTWSIGKERKKTKKEKVAKPTAANTKGAAASGFGAPKPVPAAPAPKPPPKMPEMPVVELDASPEEAEAAMVQWRAYCAQAMAQAEADEQGADGAEAPTEPNDQVGSTADNAGDYEPAQQIF